MEAIVSIITINLNDAAGLSKTLQSIKINRDKFTEVIVVDGRSTDRSQDVVRKFENTVDQSIFEKDSGIYDAMNKGMNLSSGEWLIFINSGDELLRKICEIRGDLDEKFRIIYGTTVIKGKNGRIFSWGKILEYNIDVIIRPPFFHQAILYNKRFIAKYPLEYSIIADRVMTYNILSLSNEVSWKFLNYELASFSDGGVSTNNGWAIIKEETRFLYKSGLITPTVKRQLVYKKAIYVIKLLMSFTPLYGKARKFRWFLKSLN